MTLWIYIYLYIYAQTLLEVHSEHIIGLCLSTPISRVLTGSGFARAGFLFIDAKHTRTHVES